MNYRQITGWLIYPLIYLVIILLRGAYAGFYPYPFINVDLAGYTKTISNSLLVMPFFILVAFAFVSVGKRWPNHFPQH